MSVKFETLKVGDVLYDCSTYGVGNTTMRAMGCWTVEVTSIDTDGKFAMTSWNGNPETRWWKADFERRVIRRWPPEWVLHPISSRMCAVCNSSENTGHTRNCQHPKAVKARKLAVSNA